MKINKKILVLIIVTILLVSVVGCSTKEVGVKDTEKASGKDGEPIVMTLAGVLPDDHPLTKGMYKFKEEVEERTNGELKVEVFPNGQMGQGRDLLEGLQAGNITMVKCSMGPLSSFTPVMTVFNLPYLFNEREVVYDFFDNDPVAQKLKQKVEDDTGIKVLAYWENGFRQITNSKHPIATVEDFKGLKIRTMENPVHIASFKAWGANPTPMSFGELFTGLQQGTIDGQENPLPVIASQKIEEVQKYFTISKHFYDPDGLYISSSFYNNLSSEHQTAIDEATIVATDYQRKLSTEADEELLERYKNDKSLEVVELSDDVKAELLQKSTPAYDLVAKDIGQELYDEFIEAVEKINKK